MAKRVFERELARLRERVEFSWYNRLSFEDILRDAAKPSASQRDLLDLMNVDAAGVTHEGNSALHRLSSVANAPIFSHLDGFFDGAIVGGSMHS